MACDITLFKQRFPEIDTTLIDAKFPFAVEEIKCYYEQTCLGDECNELAICMGIAHLIVLDGKTSSSPLKDVASRSVDGTSITYVQSASTGDTSLFFSSTKYGQRFLQLTQSCSYGVAFV